MSRILEAARKVVRIETEPREAAFARHNELDIHLHWSMQFHEDFYRRNFHIDREKADASRQIASDIYSEILDLCVDGNIPQHRNIVLFDRTVIPLPPKKI